MTKTEAQRWITETQRSTHRWVVDPCHATDNDILCYQGGESGKFIHIRDGLLTVGTYADAYPHIGEATFTTQGSKQFVSSLAAARFIVDKVGVGIILEIAA